MRRLKMVLIMKIILDTNFLLIPGQFKIDIFEKLRGDKLIILEPCIKELERISKGKGKDGTSAIIALTLLKKHNIKVIKTSGPADKAIINHATKHECAVATNDKALIKRLKSYSIKIIRLRQKRLLAEE